MEQYLLFDLDGTLTDPGEGITNCVGYALQKFGVHPKSREELYPYIGPPLVPSFEKYHGLTHEQAQQALLYYRERFSKVGMFENVPYPGITDLLERLKGEGYRLMIATSKPQAAAELVMHHFGLDEYVPEIIGGTDDPRRNTKGKVIAWALQELGIDPTTAIMVGDREHDVQGAAENGLPAIGITWGYGDRAELENAGAKAVLDTPEETVQYILRGSF